MILFRWLYHLHVLKVHFIHLLNERLCYQLCGHWSLILPLLESDEHSLSQKSPFKGLFQRKLGLISPWVQISPRSLDWIGPDKWSQIRPKKMDCILLIAIAPFLGLKQISPIYSEEIIWPLLRFCRTWAKFGRTLTFCSYKGCNSSNPTIWHKQNTIYRDSLALVIKKTWIGSDQVGVQ